MISDKTYKKEIAELSRIYCFNYQKKQILKSKIMSDLIIAFSLNNLNMIYIFISFF